MKGLMYSLDEKMPRWTLSESRIGENPGLGFRPMPKNISQGSLIWLDNKNASILKSYVESINDFLLRKQTQFWKNAYNYSLNMNVYSSFSSL